MALLGTVVSTALTGGDAPVFEGVAKEVAQVLKTSNATEDKVASLTAEVNRMQALLTQFMAERATPAEEVETVEPAPAKGKTTKAEAK